MAGEPEFFFIPLNLPPKHIGDLYLVYDYSSNVTPIGFTQLTENVIFSSGGFPGIPWCGTRMPWET